MGGFYQILLLVDVMGWTHRARAARQSALLTVLAIAVEKQLPLGSILDAFADDARGSWKHRVRDLADLLQSGTSLPDALESIPDLLPPEAVMAARVGGESGTLAPALRLAARRLAVDENDALGSPATVVLYLLLLSLVMFVIITFVMIWIIPKFAKIFDDFGTELPEMTQFVIGAAEGAVVWGVLLVPVVFMVTWIAFVFALAAGRPEMPMTGPFKILLYMVPRIATGGILRSLSVAVAAGRPLLGALSTLTGAHPAHIIRRRIAAVADDVERGQDCWTPLLKVGLINRREATLLAASERAGNLDWALLRTADNVDSRIAFRFNALVELVRPLLLLAYAGVVGFVVIAMFMPIIKLLNDLS